MEYDQRKDAEARGQQIIRPSKLKVGDVYLGSRGTGDRHEIVEIDHLNGRVFEKNLRTGAVSENPHLLRRNPQDLGIRRIPKKTLKAEERAGPKTTAEKAHAETEFARRVNTETAHEIAGVVHRQAAMEAKAAGDTASAEHHTKMEQAHSKARWARGIGEAHAARTALDEAAASRPAPAPASPRAAQISAFAEVGSGGGREAATPPSAPTAAATPALPAAPKAEKLKAFAEETKKKEEKAAAPMGGLLVTKHGTPYRIGPSGRRIYVKKG